MGTSCVVWEVGESVLVNSLSTCQQHGVTWCELSICAVCLQNIGQGCICDIITDCSDRIRCAIYLCVRNTGNLWFVKDFRILCQWSPFLLIYYYRCFISINWKKYMYNNRHSDLLNK